MKARERFEELRNRKIKFSLNMRLTVLVGVVVLVGLLTAFGISFLLNFLFPFMEKVPLLIQLSLFCLAVTMVATRFLSKIFFDPINELRKGMQKISDGDYEVRLESRSTSVELQEMLAGFNMMAQELSSTEILQTDFVSNVSHEFKTPINAIEGYATLLCGIEDPSPAQKEYAEKILFNTRRLSSLVSNILLLSKIENQSIPVHRAWFDLDERIRETVLSMEKVWEEKEIEWDLDLDYAEYFGNEGMMYHVWSNLISNAVKFSPRGGKISIILKKEEGRLCLSVEDEGPGLSEEAKKHAFDKFYQGDISHKEEGNGLGLALVKRILSRVDGEITAENREEGGCRFTVLLPLPQGENINKN